ncbi:hypothetical protein XELAEV_18026960mg [Xenopus laevis]|uniref:Uncharacterized protein n=1 Tax=Xenopus laevis TaxID=8355 RepID=A0A974HJC1_XENLA|nr:hypothetical protein XELAEV_18026960mg [Xenopus laevis]
MERRMSSRVKSGTKTLGVGKKVPKETIKKVFCKSKKTSCDVVCNEANSEEMMEVTQSAEVSDQIANMEDLPGASSPCEMPMKESVSEVSRCGASNLLECSLSNAEVGDSEVSEAQAEGGSSGASAEEKDKMASASSSSEASGETLGTAAPAHCHTNNTETNTVEEVTSREASMKDSPAKHMARLEALCGQLAVAVAEGALDGTEETRTGARVSGALANDSSNVTSSVQQGHTVNTLHIIESLRAMELLSNRRNTLEKNIERELSNVKSAKGHFRAQGIRKLAEMNKELEEVVENMEALLLVIKPGEEPFHIFYKMEKRVSSRVKKEKVVAERRKGLRQKMEVEKSTSKAKTSRNKRDSKSSVEEELMETNSQAMSDDLERTPVLLSDMDVSQTSTSIPLSMPPLLLSGSGTSQNAPNNLMPVVDVPAEVSSETALVGDSGESETHERSGTFSVGVEKAAVMVAGETEQTCDVCVALTSESLKHCKASSACWERDQEKGTLDAEVAAENAADCACGRLF